MKATVLHVVTSLDSGRAARMLTRLLSADHGRRASRQVVVSLTDSGVHGLALRNAGVDLHCLALTKLSRLPGAFFRLVTVLRSTRPDVVMTWLYHAGFIGTLAVIASGLGARRVVWTLSGSNQKLPGYTRTTRLVVKLLAPLSRLPWGIATSSRSSQRVHEAWGYRPRRWLHLPDITREDQLKSALESYRQLWLIASGTEPLPGAIPRSEKWLAAKVRRSLLTNTTFIAVTGSCGKTTTVRLAVDILSTAAPCYCREFHNVFQDSLKTVLSVPASSKYCIQETSAHYPGAIAKHVRVLRPDIAVVTTIGSDHYKNFRNLEATANEKGQLVEKLPRDGTAILNADDLRVRAMAARTRAKVLTFGLSPDADLRATNVSSVWPDQLTMTVVHGHESVRIQTRLVGEHWVTSVLGAIACGITCGIDLRACAQVVETFNPVFGRYSVHAKPFGPVYVLDTEKAPSWTIPKSLTLLAQAQAPRKTIVFGTISDYPGASSNRYRKIALEALEVADRVVFVGPNASHVDKLDKLGEGLFSFQSSYQASAFLAENVLPEELIYVKASASDHLERMMLSQIDRVVCWRERCGVRVECRECSNYCKPHDPPFDLAQSSPF